MAIVKVMKGDLLELFKAGAFEGIAHGCNTMNMMGAGIADQIRQQLPEAFEADTDFHERVTGSKNHKPVAVMGGELSIGHTRYGQVFNLYTQLEPGRNGDYQLLQKAMENLNKFCKQRSIQRVGVPLIAAGIAGLDIIAAMTIMNACTPDLDLTVIVWSTDDKSWQKASMFRNYSFPRKFEGFAVVKDAAKGVLSLSEDGKKWKEITFNPLEARVMHHNGERTVSLSDYDPNKYLILDEQSLVLVNMERLYPLK